MFSYNPSYSMDPFESFYSSQPDPYRMAALKRQRAEQARRQREAEEYERQRRLQELLYQRQAEEERAELSRRRRAQAEAKAEAEARARASRYRGHSQSESDEEEEDEEVEYVRHPFFGLVPRRRQQRPAQRPKSHHPAAQHARSFSIPVHSPPMSQATPALSRSTSPSSCPADVQQESAPHSPSASPQGLEIKTQAATLIQTHWRSHAVRRSAMDRIESIRSSFTTLKESFKFPAHPDFETSPESSESSSAPSLLFTATNKPIHAYEHSAMQLLTQLDAVDSAGEAKIREARKALVNEIESALKELEERKTEAWRTQQLSEAATDEQAIPEAEVSDAVDSMSDAAEKAQSDANQVDIENGQVGDGHMEIDVPSDDDWVDAQEEVDEYDAHVVDALLSTA